MVMRPHEIEVSPGSFTVQTCRNERLHRGGELFEICHLSRIQRPVLGKEGRPMTQAATIPWSATDLAIDRFCEFYKTRRVERHRFG